MYTSVLFNSLVLKPQYQSSECKVMYLEKMIRTSKTSPIVAESDIESDIEFDVEMEVKFGNEEFEKIMSNQYNTFEKKPFDSDEEWEIILKENEQLEVEYEQLLDSESDVSDEEYELYN